MRKIRFAITDNFRGTIAKGEVVTRMPDGMILLAIEELNGVRTCGMASFHKEDLFNSFQEAKDEVCRRRMVG